MKKKSLILPITLAALMVFTGCDGGNSSNAPASSEDISSSIVSSSMAPSSSVVPSSSVEPSSSEVASSSAVTATVAIQNLDDIQNNFFAGDSKELVIVADPEIDSIFDALDDGSLVITSSDPEVIKVTNFTLTALKAGQAKITVTYLGAEASVDVTVKAEKTAVDLYGTDHAGTEDDPLNTADAVKVAAAVGTDKSVVYYIQGTIFAYYHFPGENASYTSFFFEPANDGDPTFEAYKISMPGDPQVGVPAEYAFPGAEVVVKGRITTYSGQAETDTGEFVKLVSGEKPEMKTITGKTVSELVTAAKAGVDGDVTFDSYTVSGYVQAISGNNYFIGDEKLEDGETPVLTNLLEIYSYDVAAKGLADGSVDDKILVGSKVELTCHVKRYHDQIEAVVLTGLVNVVEKGAVIEATKASVTEALAIGYALEGGEVTATTYEVTGVVCKRGSWNSTYGNGDLYIAETADETDASKMLQLYRVKDEAVFNAARVGDSVTAIANLTRYIQTDKTTGEVKKDIVETAEGPKVQLAVINRNVTEIREIGLTLAEKNEITNYTVVVTGYIVDLGEWSTQFNNVDLKIADSAEDTTNTFTIYRFTNKEVYDTLALGDYISVEAHLTRYNSTIETVQKEAVITKLEKPVGATYVDGVPGETKAYALGSSSDYLGWATSYAEHVFESDTIDEALPSLKFTFSKHNKQTAGNAIDDCPVSKAGDLKIEVLGTVGFKSVTVTFKQWGSKAQTVKVTSGGSELVAPASLSFDGSSKLATVTATSESALTELTFSATEGNQVGWVSVEVTF